MAKPQAGEDEGDQESVEKTLNEKLGLYEEFPAAREDGRGDVKSEPEPDAD